jgi:hypothetical protein
MLHMVTRLAATAAIALAVAGCTTDATGAGSSGAAGRPVGSSSPAATAPPKHHRHHRAPAVHAGPGWTVRRARSVLPHLRVHAARSMRGYDRDRFGPAWEDVDGDGCDTRDDILNRDLTARTWDDAAHCEVRRGVLRDPYTGRLIHFRRGVETSLAVQIDHMVALADAWCTGAARWPAGRRLAYANDPRVLIAVDGTANEQKSDDDASQWLPPNRRFRCQYVADQVMIKATYRLWVTPAERAAMAGVLRGC